MPRTSNNPESKPTGGKSAEPVARAKGKVLIPSGSTLLNIACSDSPWGAFLPGTVVNPVGDRHAGKSLLCLTSLAATCLLKPFKDYALEYFNGESRMMFDIRRLFGRRLERRLRITHTETIQQFADGLGQLIDADRPFIAVLDTFDGVTSNEEVAKAKKVREGSTKKGTYGLDKTKALSGILRQATQGLDRTNSLLLLVSQVRENLDGSMYTPKYYHTGGRALAHATFHEIWLYRREKIKRTVRGKPRTIGSYVSPRVEKNKLTGHAFQEFRIPVYPSYGIDDVGSCVDWLVSEGFWKKRGQTIRTREFGEATRGKLLRTIEEDGLVRDLQTEVGEAWAELEEGMQITRQRRFE